MKVMTKRSGAPMTRHWILGVTCSMFMSPLAAGQVADADLDGIPDALDNCVFVANAFQVDGDNDGYGNACDADLNNDCSVNFVDLGVLRSVFFSADTAADFNNDGVVNFLDLGIMRSAFFQPPGPSAQSSVCGGNCAFFVDDAGHLRRGEPVGSNCVYPASFSSTNDPVVADITFAALPNDGAHILDGSLVIGQWYVDDGLMAADGLERGGDGPTLTIEAGAVLAFSAPEQTLFVNRGSQIFAVGSADAPITLTSLSDVDVTLPEFDATAQWGGVQINGFGITNQCDYVIGGSLGELATTQCHVRSLGSSFNNGPHYGGDVVDDDSGHLEFVVIKHTGGASPTGGRRPGLHLLAVGQGTTLRHVEVYAAFQDGFAIEGGSANLNNIVAMYVGDDSIDLDEGFSGEIANALIVQGETTGNTCAEVDGVWGFSSQADATIDQIIALGINTQTVLRNVSCFVSPSAQAGIFDPGAGLRIREGAFVEVIDSLVISAFGVDSPDSNYCLRLDNRSAEAAVDGDVTIASTVFACQDRTHFGQLLPDGTSVEQFAIDSGNVFATVTSVLDPTPGTDPSLALVNGAVPIFSLDYSQMVVDGAPLSGAPVAGSFIGAVGVSGNDWLAGWTYGLFEGARGAPLWFDMP